MSRCLYTGGRRLRAVGPVLVFALFAGGFASSVSSTATRPSDQGVMRGSADGFIRNPALARLLGQMLYEDTVHAIATAPQGGLVLVGTAPPGRDNSAVAQVARTVLSQQSLDRYLWLIRQAYDDTMWRGGDRGRIEEPPFQPRRPWSAQRRPLS